MPVKCIKAFISGRVQGVFFRDSTRQQAISLGITGHAKNLPDRRVEVIACGETHNIDRLINWLHTGPEYARVEDVSIEQIKIEKPVGFYIR